jgi:hypothetical protein
MGHWKGMAALVAVAIVVGGWPVSSLGAQVQGSTRVGAATGVAGHGARRAPLPRSLEIYYSNPVLVRAGERVRVPVDVVCATAAGRACSARATVSVQDGTGWRSASAAAASSLAFDVSAAAGRTTAGSAVPFFIQASGAGRVASLPSPGRTSPLLFYVTTRMPVTRIPRIPFGQVKKPVTALSLPWGTGPRRAGIELGRESVTIGPSSFEVDPAGAVHLLDALQQRLATFSRGRLVRSTHLSVHPRADLALTRSGVAFVLDSAGSSVVVRQIDPSGRPLGTVQLGSAIPSQLRAAGDRAFAQLLPVDGWVQVPAATIPGAAPTSVSRTVSVGLPDTAGGQLLSVAREDRVRLGMVTGTRVHRAVELRSAERFGELALSQTDGHDGYYVVVRVWRSTPTPADQYQFVHLARGRIAQTFAMADERFAESAPLSKFRIGSDGNLYQLVSSPAGMRIVRYDLGRKS